MSPTERRPSARPRNSAAEEAAASPPVLSLSHFCRSPFLCFGDVRLGASRTLPLALDNPNEEVAEVKIAHFPAAEQGFSILPRSFELQVGRWWAGRAPARAPSAGSHAPSLGGARLGKETHK